MTFGGILLTFGAFLKVLDIKLKVLAVNDSISLIELVVGLFCVFDGRVWLARNVLFVVFSVFASVAGWRFLTGATTCGCFGALSIRPFVTLLLDLIVLGLLSFSLLLRNQTLSRTRPISDFLIRFSLLSLVFSVAIAVQLRTKDELTFKDTNWFLPRELTLIADGADEASAKFKFVNETNRKITQIRINRSCGCTFAFVNKDSLLPGEEAEVELRVGSEGWRNRSQIRIELVFNNGSYVQSDTCFLVVKGGSH